MVYAGSGNYDSATWYAFDGSQPVLDFNQSGAMTERNLVAPNPAGVDAVMAQEAIATPGQAGTLAWPLDDDLGTPHDVVNNSSAVVDHMVTDSYGQIASQTSSAAQPFNGFGGGHLDTSTGDVTDFERNYDPATGGWTTKDPTGFMAGDPNTGRYAGNSPTNAVDPTGLVPMTPWSGGDYTKSPALAQAYAEWMRTGISPTVPPGFWQSLMNVVNNEVTTQYLMMMRLSSGCERAG
ncbi:MAG: RHS repeat-associated core domain-containing protein [Pirellulales bacterium]